MRVNETPSYLRAWLANPLKFGAVAPSGPALAALITREISASSGPILELGPGKGVFTEALLERGVAESDLVLVEQDPGFVTMLRKRYPLAQVVSMDADHLHRLGDVFAGRPAGGIVSGLPLLTMPPGKVCSILSGSFEHLRDNGAMYQFTYMPRCPVPQKTLDSLGLEAERIGGALLNIPPAAVYRLVRNSGR